VNLRDVKKQDIYDSLPSDIINARQQQQQELYSNEQ